MNTAARYAVLGALFLIPIIPLYVANAMFFPFITGKAFAFRILVEIAAVAYVVLAVADKKYRPQFSWVLALYGAFVGWMLIADLFAINAQKALWSNFERMDGWVTLIHLFLFFLVAGSVLTADRLWKRWWYTFITVSAFVCVYSLFQLAGMIQINQGGVRVDATFGNAIYLAVYLLFSVFITLWHAFEEKKGWLRYALFALVAAQVIILFNTATRGAIVAIVAASALAAFLWMLRAGKQGKRIAAGALAGVVVLVGGFWLMRDAEFVRESPIFSRVASISLGELKVRLTLWDMALEGVAERPLTGYGQEGFNYIFNEHYRPSLYAQEPWFDRAHNAYVDWLVAGGYPAALLFLALLLMGTWALYRDPEASDAKRIFLVSAMAAYAVQALVVFDNLFSYVPLAALLAMAHAASARPIARLEQASVPKQQTVDTYLAPTALVAGLLIIWIVNVPNMRAANHLVYAISPLPGGPEQNLSYFHDALDDGSFATQEIREQLVNLSAGVAAQPNISTQVKSQFLTLALDEIGKEIERVPFDARLRIERAVAYRAAGQYENALREIDKAIELSPMKQPFHLERGSVLAELGRTEEARASFYAAYELDPSFKQLVEYAAVGDIVAGDVAAAKALLLKEFGTTTIDSDPLMRAYYQAKMYPELLELLRFQASSGETEARIRLISGYAIAGRFAEGRAEANRLIADDPSSITEVQKLLASFPSGR